MIKSDSFLADRIIWRAEQHEFPHKNSFLYSNLKESEKNLFDVLVSDNEIGIPVLFFRAANQKWTILGTRKVISGSLDNFSVVTYAIIKETSPTGIPFLSEVDDNHEEEDIDKRKLNELRVRDIEGKESVLYTSKGADFFMLHNTLLVLINLTKGDKTDKR